MTRIITLVALLVTLMACSREQLDQTAAQVQKYTVEICSFLPTQETVVSIIKASPASTTIYNIALAICSAVTANPTGVQPALFIADEKPANCPEVNGVCIKGEFVEPKNESKPPESTPPEPAPNSQDFPKDMPN